MDEIFEVLRSLRKKSAVSIVCLVVFAVLGFVTVNIQSIGIIGVVFFIPAIIAFILVIKFNRQFTTYYKDNVVRGILGEVFTDMTFEPGRGISYETISNTQMMRMGNRFRSNDLITGKYNGVRFEQSDVCIEDESTDSDGHTTTTTIFSGRWMIVDFNKEFNCDMQVVSKRFFSSKHSRGLFASKDERLRKVELENEEFNKHFRVFAQDEHEVFYILTPHMMEAVNKIKDSSKAPFMLAFAGGRLHIALQNSRDAFEPRLFGKIEPEIERERVLADTRVLTDFIDTMALDKDIYKN